jgi:DNA repair ATPase RecN
MTTSHSAGARWIRAALQVNPYAYNGRGAPANAFKSEDEYNDALLDRFAAQGVELIAITDHWCVNTAGSLIDAATARDIVALPGFEANSAEGVHLLVIFEAGTDFADINAAIGVCGGTPGCANGTAGEPYADILRKMGERGALVIPAHVNVANGGMLTGRSGPPLVNMVTHPDLHAIAVTPDASAATDQEAVCAGRKPYDRVHPLSVVFADDVTHPNAVGSRGAATWFKVSSRRLENLKLAVRTPATRIAVEDPRSTPRPLIRQISWVGGFLDGVTVPLSPDLTALIGGRGTGKSTVIESLRYVLGVDALGQEAKRDHAAIVSGVLRSGTTVRLEVKIISPVPRRYTIERSVPNPPVVRDASGSSTNLLPADVIGTVEIFGQHELAELAHDKASVARMLERFAGATGPDAEHDQIVGRLTENREKLQRAEKARDDLEEELADIPRLEEHVAHYTATDLPTRLSELQRLDRDSGVFTEATERVTDVRSILQPLADQQVVASLTAPIEAIDESPQKLVLERVTAATRSLSNKLAELQAAADAAVREAVQAIEAAEAEWKVSTEPQRASHAEVLRKLVEDGHDPDKYLATTKALDTLKAKAQRREGMVKTLSELSGQRGELLGELATNESKRLEKLHDAIRSANSATKGVVIVRPVAAPDRRQIKAVVEQGVKGARTQIMAAIDSEGFSPRAFVAAARVNAEELEEKFSVKGAQAASLMAAGEPLFRELEELSVGQAVDVQLDIAAGSGPREYRSLEDLSKGQRATALLLLLLGASSAPLVIDQPEDDLDNRFVYDGIVQKLRELKGKRQIIASTHNANVPVLGDAELIVALEGDGQHGWPAEQGVGSLDDAKIRSLAENLLEGGPAAFNARQHLYGF